jgi:Predicted membrane protein (DUF2207)
MNTMQISQNIFNKLLQVIFIVLMLSFPRVAYAEYINDFSATYGINSDGTVEVKETIQYDFQTEEKHGIYRTIPFITTNSEGKRYKIVFKDISVTDESGAPYRFSKTMSSDDISLKIGDPNATITGMHTYVIGYQLLGALTYFSDHDELYWNVTGTGWNVPIFTARAIVMFPAEFTTAQVKPICYTGFQGATEQQCTGVYANNKASFYTSGRLGMNQGLTIAASFPRDVVAVLEPKEVVNFWDTIFGKIFISLFMMLGLGWYFILPLWIIYRWYKYGRDPKPPMGVARAWFEAPKTQSGRLLTPGETGTLIDEEADMRDITATIVDLARRRYMKIIETAKNDFTFKKQKTFIKGEELEPHEKTMIDKLFGSKDEIRIKDADVNTFFTMVTTMKKKLYDAVVKEKFFDESPESTRTKYYVIAGFALFTGNFWLAIIAFFFGRAMPRKTPEGAQAAAIAKSLKNFLTSQEKRITDQANKQLFFEKLLPYAVAFGVEKVWAERFKDIDMKEPDWYQGYGVHAFNSMYLMRALGTTGSSFARSATPVSSSTGHSSGFSGGFSGGGGGGGGGGSW